MHQSQMPTKTVAGVKVPADLDAFGFDSDLRKESTNDFRPDRINAARKLIQEHFSKIKTINQKEGSYSLKHQVEAVLGEHLSNGELIVAMIGEGYSIHRYGVNCYFNVSGKSTAELRALYQPPKPKRISKTLSTLMRSLIRG